jgi:hypothetical protein
MDYGIVSIEQELDIVYESETRSELDTEVFFCVDDDCASFHLREDSCQGLPGLGPGSATGKRFDSLRGTAVLTGDTVG